jgi:hypothetical protein
LGSQALGGAQGGVRIAGDQRVREGPGSLLGGVGHHRREIVDRHLSFGPRPQGQALELVGEPQRAVPEPLDQKTRCAGLEREAAPVRIGDQPSGQLARLGRLVAQHLAARGLDGFGQPLGRPRLGRQLAGDQDQREIRRQPAELVHHRLGLLDRPPLDPIGQQIAPRRHQRQGGDRSDEGVGVGRLGAGRRREALQRPGAALALGSLPQAGQRRVDLPLVGAGDQVGGLDRAPPTRASRITGALTRHGAECIHSRGRS